MRRPLPSPRVLWETLRHLRFRQVRYRLVRHIFPRFLSYPFPLRWKETEPQVNRAKNTSRVFFDGLNFCFNNESRVFTGDWNEPGVRKLWLYNLHYMTWLFDLEEGREDWIKRWIRENPPAQNGAGWDPYPLSLRLFNWCKHYSLAGLEPDSEVLASMGMHISRLLSHLEFHLDGNHLLENLLALVFAGSFLETANRRAAKARNRIQTLLEAELSRQFLADGGHYELSPMYHAIQTQ